MQLDIAHMTEPCPAPPMSFHDLLLNSLPSLRVQAMALTRHRADAEDLVQQAVVNALRAQNTFEPGTNFRAWMGCIMRNRFFTNLQRHRPTVALDESTLATAGRSGGQEESVALQELYRCLTRLPVKHREDWLLGEGYERAVFAVEERRIS